MPLHLHYVDSVAPFLAEIKNKIIKEHIDFNRQDSFRIITPESISKIDMEDLFLHSEPLQGVLIGKSILSFSEFWRQTLFFHPTSKEVANAFAEKKALRWSLQKNNLLNNPDPHQVNIIWQEYHRILELQNFGIDIQNNNWKKTHDLLDEYLEEKLGVWSQKRAKQESWFQMGQKEMGPLKGVREFYFLGFLLPSQDLIHCFRAIQKIDPSINIFFFIPSKEKGMDPKGLLKNLFLSLEEMVHQKTIHKKISPPKIFKEVYPTPIHEALNTYQQWEQNPQECMVFYPDRNSSQEFFLRKLYQNQPITSHYNSVRSGTSPFRLLEAIRKDWPNQDLVSFETVFERFFPLFDENRQALSNCRNLPSLKYLEEAYSKIIDLMKIEERDPENRSPLDWFLDIEESFSEIASTNPHFNYTSLPLRNIYQPGLKAQQKIFVTHLNESSFPKFTSQYFFLNPHDDPLASHQANLQFENLFYLAINEIHLSHVEFSLSGRASAPSIAFQEIEGNTLYSNSDSQYFLRSPTHPYFKENVTREKERKQDREPNQDFGNLTSIKQKLGIHQKLKKRPLSASYLNRYAKCPWLFFADWHLELREILEEDIEVEPKFKGILLHRILEMIFRELAQNSFSKNQIPQEDDLIKVTQKCLEKAWIEIPNMENSSFFPPRVLADEVEQIAYQIEKLLREEWESWQNSSQPLIPKYIEWQFGKGNTPPLYFSLPDNPPIPFSGAIDRVDVQKEGNHFLVIDYKSSGSEILAQDIRNKKEFQLYLYIRAVKEILLPDMNPIGGLYWDVKKLKKNQGLVLKEDYEEIQGDKTRGSTFLTEEKYQNLKFQIEKELQDQLKAVLNGNYSLQPEECLGQRCSFHKICRYDKQPK